MSETKTHASDVVDLFLEGVERASELQKKALEAATEQTSQALAASKRAMDAMASGPDMLNTVERGFHRYIDAQKKLIDLVVQKTAAMAEASKESGTSAATMVEEFAQSIQTTVERAIEIEKEALGVAAPSAKRKGEAARHKP